MKDLGSEIEFKQDGMIQTRAQDVLNDAVIMLKDIEDEGLTNSISKGSLGALRISFPYVDEGVIWLALYYLRVTVREYWLL